MDINRLPAFFRDFFLGASETELLRLQPVVNYLSLVMAHCLDTRLCQNGNYTLDCQPLFFAVRAEKAADIEAVLDCRFFMKNPAELLHLHICFAEPNLEATLNNVVATIKFLFDEAKGTYTVERMFSDKAEHLKVKTLARINTFMKTIIDPGIYIVEKKISAP